MKIIDNKFFIIDSSNWNMLTKDFFYGYKTVENEGFWLQIRRKSANTVYISTSYISPVIVIYKLGGYWAISNSYLHLINFLIEAGHALIDNPEFNELQSQTNTSFSYDYKADVLPHINFSINDNFEELLIADGELYKVRKNFKFFNKPIFDNLQNLFDWYNKYNNYLGNAKNISCGLSGGLDSRLLWYLFIRNNKSAKINCWYNKPNVTDGLDYELAEAVLAYYGATADKVSTRKVHRLNEQNEDNNSKSPTKIDKQLNEFLFGISYNPIKFTASENTEQSIRVLGTASNIFRYEFQDLDFINGNIRRNWVTLFIARYYLLNQVYVLPYIDSLLLELATEKPDFLHVILYNIFAKSLLLNGIPFITKSKKGKYYLQDLHKDLFKKFVQYSIN